MENNIKKILFIILIIPIITLSQERDDIFYIKIDESEIIKPKIDKNGYFITKISEIEKFINECLLIYENNGYPFVEIKLDEINENKAKLLINSGQKYIIDSIIINEESKIPLKIISNIINIEKGDIYNQKKINDIENLINICQFIKQNKKNELVFHAETVDLYLYLDWASSNYLDGLIGLYSEDNKLQLNGNLNLKFNNNLKLREEILINFNSKKEDFQKLNAIISIPLTKRLNSSSKLNIYKKYDQFVNIESVLNINSDVLKNHNLGLIIKNKKSSSDQSEIESSESNMVGANYTISLNKINLQTIINIGNRKISDEKYQHLECELDLSIFTNLYNKISVIKLLNSKMMFSNNLTTNELFIFGGINSIKGFIDDQFNSDNLHILSVDFLYKLDENLISNIFFQNGWYSYEREWKRIRSFGTGLDIINNNNKIYIKYAFGMQKNQPLEFQNGRIYIGIINSF